MPSQMNYFRTKAHDYRRLAVNMTGGSVRLQLRNMAEYYERMAELYEEEHQWQSERAPARRWRMFKGSSAAY